MLCASTAKRDRSIWNTVTRRTFETRVDDLSRTGIVPEPRVLTEKDWPEERTEDILPFGTAMQLSDDFAFISACEYGAACVTVATLERPREDLAGFTLRLAANGGISDRVKVALTNLLAVLQNCARKQLPREQCAEQAFDIIVNLNLNRILGRLESKHFQRPAYDRGQARSSLTVRLNGMLSSAVTRTANEKSNRAKLSLEVEAMHTSFCDLENATLGEATFTDALKAVVKDAYKITINGVSLPHRLREMGESRTDSREIREINKIANYWRICLELAHLSRLYRSLFTGLRLETLEHYMPLQNTRQKRFVHAEIQMIAYYETSPSAVWPLALGCSKEACYLCHSFIKAHGSFYVSKAHRQIFNQWTVPDLSEYSDETVQRFRMALAAVDKVVIKDLKRARSAPSLRQAPLQSSINLRKLELPTPSLTTVTESVASGPERFPDMSSGPQESTFRLDEAEADSQISERRTIDQTEATLQDKHKADNFVVTAVSPKHAALGWLNVHMYVESPFHSSLASVHFENLPDEERAEQNMECQCFDIEDMAFEEEVTVTSPDSGESQLEFILMSKTRKAVRVKCLWH